MQIFGKIRDFSNLRGKKQEIVNFKLKTSAKTKAPTKKNNETKFVELTFNFRS